MDDVESEVSNTLALIKGCIDVLKKSPSGRDFSPLGQPIQDNSERSLLLVQSEEHEAWPQVPESSSHFVLDYFLPLVINLGRLYEVLDAAVRVQCETTTIDKKPKGNRNKPKAPPGLLSLRHYTDICAFLEIIVCATFLPAIPKNVLLSIEDRVRYQLPKTIAGRVDHKSLVWAHSQGASCDFSQAILPVTAILGRFLLLDRFRPMLLPRHLLDLYAALLFLLHGRDPPPPKINPIYDLARQIGVEQQQPSKFVDARTQALTFQTLLRCGRQAPQWLQSSISQRLQHLATHDLGAVISVFVAAAPEPSAAAQRLARTLENYNDNSAQLSNLLQLLDTIHSKTIEKKQAHAIVYTIWAVLESDSQFMKTFLCSLLTTDDTAPLLLERVETLWTIVPPRDLACRFLFLPALQGDCSVMGFLLRLACHHSVLHSTIKSKVYSFWKKIVAEVLDDDDREGVFSVGLLHSMEFCEWDSTMEIELCAADETYSVRRLEERNSPTLDHVVGLLEQRTRCICQHILSVEGSSLGFAFFRSLLVCYVSEQSPRHFVDPLVVLVALPLVCETLPLDSLLINHGSTGLFSIMKVVFAQSSLLLGSDSGGVLVPTKSEDSFLCKAFSAYSKCIGQDGSPHQQPVATTNLTETFVNKEELLFSITSILLSILVSVLELGAPNRSHSDENELLALVDSVGSISASAGKHDEIAEMASHAVALIQARSASSTPVQAKSFDEKFEQSKVDLKSTEPPLRARGVVMLRNLANALCSDTALKHSVTVSRLLDLTIQALGDDESYVYLAAIHTIVAIADADPSLVIPLLSSCFVSGVLRTQEAEVTLSLNQRAKLTEALACIVRRGVSLGNELPQLLRFLCFGPNEKRALIESLDEALEHRIKTETHRYFLDHETDEREFDENQYWEDTALRVRTGGPLFADEESDLVRAGWITVASELVAVLSSATLVQFVGALVDCCIHTLRLDTSRPVRRTGASLAREIYSVLLREDNVDYAASIVSGKHSTLVAVLERCKSADDLEDLGHSRQFDRATAARCEEALDIVEETKLLLQAGLLAVEEEKLRNQNPIVRLLQTSREQQQVVLLKDAEQTLNF